MESESGSRPQSSLKLSTLVLAQGVWSTQNMCSFCSFKSSGSCFKSNRNLKSSCALPKHTPNPIPSAGLAPTSPTPVPRLTQQGRTCPSLFWASSWIGEASSLLHIQDSGCNYSSHVMDPANILLIRVQHIPVSVLLNAILGGSGTRNLKSYLTYPFGRWGIMKLVKSNLLYFYHPRTSSLAVCMC